MTQFFLCINLVSCVEIRLHTEVGRVWLCRTVLVLVCGLSEENKAYPTFVELSWVWQKKNNPGTRGWSRLRD